jgi:hypothetical protein
MILFHCFLFFFFTGTDDYVLKDQVQEINEEKEKKMSCRFSFIATKI